MKKTIIGFVLLAAVLNSTACGYFLYPERVGQSSGKIDPTVVILDAAGLLVGVLPGVVAFAVDLTTGTLFLSPGGKSAIEKHGQRSSITNNLQPVGNEQLPIDRQATAKELSKLLGQPVDADRIQYYKTKEISFITQQGWTVMAKLEKSPQRSI